jgi:hypothetical protein
MEFQAGDGVQAGNQGHRDRSFAALCLQQSLVLMVRFVLIFLVWGVIRSGSTSGSALTNADRRG